ncbi:hypothetical protein NQZ68_014682 [Dissostichus eleginoides]|nr:hypothetical protein NQZ68_014682 [Dissostichus eleginoides]
MYGYNFRCTAGAFVSVKLHHRGQSVGEEEDAAITAMAHFSPETTSKERCNTANLRFEIKATPLEESEYFRCGEQAAFLTTCEALREGPSSRSDAVIGAPGAGRHKPGPPV